MQLKWQSHHIKIFGTRTHNVNGHLHDGCMASIFFIASDMNTSPPLTDSAHFENSSSEFMDIPLPGIQSRRIPWHAWYWALLQPGCTVQLVSSPAYHDLAYKCTQQAAKQRELEQVKNSNTFSKSQGSKELPQHELTININSGLNLDGQLLGSSVLMVAAM